MSRLRKLQKTEGQRRSPRISALEAEAHGHGQSIRHHLDNSQGPAFRTRGKRNTKSRLIQQVTPSPNQGVKHFFHQDIQNKSCNDKPSNLESSTFLPDKRKLQLVLDTLQRRDTYEIFAEPVNPNEVEDYYAIIKEPMDFGTMRAKLHEGMYKSLKQFEARVIKELAKKVFDLLKNNPEKFELEFSETRRKVCRRNQGDFRDSTNLKSYEIAIGVPSKTMPCSSRDTSNKRNFKAKNVDARDVEIIVGTKESSRCRSFEIDKRHTYKPLSLEEDKLILSTVYGKLKLLEHVSQQDIGYKDSLMLFVRDLGPTAQNIAKRKLLGCEIHTASSYTPCRSDTFNIVTTSNPTSQYHLDQFLGYPNDIKSHWEKISGREKIGGALNGEREKGCSHLDGNTLRYHSWSFGCDKEFTKKRFCFDSCYSQAHANDFTCLNQRSEETGKNPKRILLDK